MIDEIDEFAHTEPRVLTMTYLVRCTYKDTVQPGPGGVSRAIESACRTINGQPNILADTIRFKVDTP